MDIDELATIKTKKGSRSWARSLFSPISFPDLRLKRRVIKIIEKLIRYPRDSFSVAFPTWGELKAFFRFLSNRRVSPELLEEAVIRNGVLSCADHQEVYVTSDTTTISLDNLKKRNPELGHTNDQAHSKGFFVHTSLAMTLDGVPLGIVDQQVWTRDRDTCGKRKDRRKKPITEKESFKWISSLRTTQERFQEYLGNRAPRPVFIFDREGDIYEVFQEVHNQPVGLVVRSAYNRRVEDSDLLLKSLLEKEPIVTTYSLEIPARPATNKKPARPKRSALVSVRYRSSITLTPSSTSPKGSMPLSVAAVLVREDHLPLGLDEDERVSWLLLTTQPVTSTEDALNIILIYKLRWRVEEFHLVLKSGCRIEAHQFNTFEPFHKVTTLLSAVACELLRLTYLSRLNPQKPATVALSERQCQVLMTHMLGKPGPHPIPTIGDAIRMIGRMGGHIGRKRDGPPGVRTLWKGWRDLQLLTSYDRSLHS